MVDRIEMFSHPTTDKDARQSMCPPQQQHQQHPFVTDPMLAITMITTTIP
jgi:hypothetical protein